MSTWQDYMVGYYAKSQVLLLNIWIILILLINIKKYHLTELKLSWIYFMQGFEKLCSTYWMVPRVVLAPT